MNSEDFYQKYFHFALLAFLIIICYSNTLHSSWHFDDIPSIVENDSIHMESLTWENLQKAVFFSLGGNGEYSRPVASLSFALNYLVSGLDTTSYHIVNIIIHIVTAFLLYLIFAQTVQLYFLRHEQEVFSSITVSDIALLGAVLWAIHPIHTQAVTYIVQRQAIMAAMFYFSALYCYIKLRLSPQLVQQIFLSVLVVLFWALGTATKQNAIMLPAAIIGYELAFFRSSLAGYRKWYLSTAIIILSFFIFFVFVSYGSEIFGYLTSAYKHRSFTMWQRLMTEPIILCRYLFLLFYPISDFLVLESDIVASTTLFTPPETILAIVFIGILFTASGYWLRSYPVVCYALFFFFINHIVESTFIGLELYFEHRNYLPSAFIYLMLSFYFLRYMSHCMDARKIFMQALLFFCVAVWLTSEGNATYLRNYVWKDEITLHKDHIDKSPNNIRAYVALAVNSIRVKEYDLAQDYLKQAESMYLDAPQNYQSNWIALVYYNAGVLYREKGEYEKAIGMLLKSLEYDPAYWLSHVNLGIIFFHIEDIDNAAVSFFNAINLRNKYLNNAGRRHMDLPVEFYSQYGRVLYELGQYDQAENIFNQGLMVEKVPALQFNLIASFLAQGERERAKKIFFQIPYNGNNIQYLLYKAYFSDGVSREIYLAKIASILEQQQTDFCEWLNKIKRNYELEIIYPDISSYEEQLRKAYVIASEEFTHGIVTVIDAAGKCDFTQQGTE